MNDEQMQPLLEAWFRDRDEAPRDATRGIAQVMTLVSEARQRDGRLPSLLFRRKARSHTAADIIECEPGLISATHASITTVTGRNQIMFSPVKALIAGVLVFALGGVYLIAQPFEPRPAAAPAAGMTALPGVTATAHQECVGTSFDSPCTWTASDPRLTGAFSGEATGDISDDRPGEGLRTGFTWLDHTLEGPDSSWTGHSYVMWTEPFQHLIVLSGSGAYEGLHYVAMAITEAGPPIDWTGVIYEGELPPFGPLSTSTAE